jgi:hypothetical protein
MNIAKNNIEQRTEQHRAKNGEEGIRTPGTVSRTPA